MITRRSAMLSVLAFGGLLGGAAIAATKSKGPLAALDTDNDGTVDLNEAKKAATALFERLDSDHDGTLTKAEVGRHLSAKDFKSADKDNDGTLSKDEFLAVVEARFKAADADNDGTLTADELKSKAGQALLRLLK